jgi:hypothetical protein
MYYITFQKKPNGSISLLHRHKKYRYTRVIYQNYVSNKRSIIYYSSNINKLQRLATKIKLNSFDIWRSKDNFYFSTGLDKVNQDYAFNDVRLIQCSEYMHPNRIKVVNDLSKVSVVVLFHHGLNIDKFIKGDYQIFLIE